MFNQFKKKERKSKKIKLKNILSKKKSLFFGFQYNLFLKILTSSDTIYREKKNNKQENKRVPLLIGLDLIERFVCFFVAVVFGISQLISFLFEISIAFYLWKRHYQIKAQFLIILALE